MRSAELPELPRFTNEKPQPWDVADLNRLLAAARTMPGDVAGIPARLWWRALLLSLVDTAASAAELLAAPRTAYVHRRGTLAVGALVYRLHAYTVEALDRIRRHESECERLLPWPLDNGRPPFHVLHRRFKTVLYRAGLPHVADNQFDRLRVTGRQTDALQALDLTAVCATPHGRPSLPRARDKQSWAAIVRARDKRSCAPTSPTPGRPTLRDSATRPSGRPTMTTLLEWIVGREPVPPFRLRRRSTRCRRRRIIRWLLWLDDPRCVYCEWKMPFCKTTLDHVHPRSRGGTEAASNLVLCCRCCNTFKGDGPAPRIVRPAPGRLLRLKLSLLDRPQTARERQVPPVQDP